MLNAIYYYLILCKLIFYTAVFEYVQTVEHSIQSDLPVKLIPIQPDIDVLVRNVQQKISHLFEKLKSKY